MPLTPFLPAPGIVKEDTAYASKGRWVDGQNVRFRDGRPENIKGWQRKVFLTGTVTGVPRDIIAWQELAGFRNYAFGTDSRLYVVRGGELSDVTPIRRAVVGAANALTTTNGSAIVTVSDTNHGGIKNDTVIFSNASGTVGGLTISGEVTVATVTDANTWTFVASSNATSNDTGPASIDIDYLIHFGEGDATFGFGWGTGPYGDSTWGTPRSSSTVILEPGQWSLSNWGEDLVAGRRDSLIYYYDASAGPTNRATIISANAPTASRFTLVSRPDRHLIAFGTEQTIGNPATQDDLFIRWCDIENFADWTPTSANTAGTQRLSGGSKIVAALNTRREILIWTDEGLWTMRFTGGTFVFAHEQIGIACGSIGQHAAIEVNGFAYWMGDCDFYIYDGVIRPLECPVHAFVFDNIDRVQGDKVYAGHIRSETEIIWFYQDESGSDVNRCVAFNYVDGTWWIGNVDRSVWLDAGVFKNPIAANPSGAFYDHEIGTSDDGDALECFVESGDVDVDPDQVGFLKRIIPDMLLNSGNVQVTIKARKYPNGTQVTKGPFTITSTTQKIHPRIRGRQLSYRIESNANDASWRLGTPRFDVQPDGQQ